MTETAHVGGFFFSDEENDNIKTVINNNDVEQIEITESQMAAQELDSNDVESSSLQESAEMEMRVTENKDTTLDSSMATTTMHERLINVDENNHHHDLSSNQKEQTKPRKSLSSNHAIYDNPHLKHLQQQSVALPLSSSSFSGSFEQPSETSDFMMDFTQLTNPFTPSKMTDPFYPINDQHDDENDDDHEKMDYPPSDAEILTGLETWTQEQEKRQNLHNLNDLNNRQDTINRNDPKSRSNHHVGPSNLIFGSVDDLKQRNRFCSVPNGQFRTAKSTDGHLLYFPLKSRKSHVDAFQRDKKRKGLLKVPIHTMMTDLKLSTDYRLLDIPDNNSNDANMNINRRQQSQVESQLWVNKYSPKFYVDLVGDERTNRNVLSWVKQWDPCVFGKEYRPPVNPNQSPSFSKKGYSNNNYKSSNPIYYSKAADKNVDPIHRPDKKILLLTGRAGLGKTTLAHVAAKHAGYNVIEINASDDRTGEALRNKLLGAVESKGLAANGKPTLVVIDEIDGASQTGQGDNNFMKLLVDLVTSGSKESNPDESKSKKKKKKKDRKLMRPIICICNDLYAPVLRTLRPHAQIFTITAPPYKVLAKRLMEICQREELKTDFRALMYLCESTDGDLRSCLNTLQFMKKSDLPVTLETLQAQDIGNKDMQKSMFNVWDGIFVSMNAKQKLKVNKGDLVDRYVDRLHKLIASNGDYNKIMQGCFDNYLRTRPVDPLAWTDIGDCIQMYDMMDHRLHAKNDWDMAGYLPYSLISFHKLFASARPMSIEYPKNDYDNYLKTKFNHDLINSLYQGLTTGIRRCWFTATSIVTECLPYLVRIISPDIKGTNSHHLKKSDKLILDNVVENMAAFGLKYVSRAGEGGVMKYELEPPMHLLFESLCIDETKKLKYISGSNVFKQLVTLEMERTIMRLDLAQTPEKSKPLEIPKRPSQSLENTIEAKKLKLNLNEDNIRKDFFGRPILPKVPEPTNEEIENNQNEVMVVKSKIVFKFKEGFSNAVRKPLCPNDIF